MDNRKLCSINRSHTNIFLSEEEIGNVIAAVVANNESQSETNDSNANFANDVDENKSSKRQATYQKCVDDMSTSELIHLITNGVKTILLHSTNEDFRRSNFSRLKVRNTEDAAVVFRNQFLKMFGLQMDTSPEAIKLLQEEKENLPCVSSHNSFGHFSLQNSGSVINSRSLLLSQSQPRYSDNFSEQTGLEILESSNEVLHNNSHELSPSLLENINENGEDSTVLPFETDDGASKYWDTYSEQTSGSRSPSLLENMEMEPLFGENLDLPIQTRVDSSEINSEKRLCNTGLENYNTHTQQNPFDCQRLSSELLNTQPREQGNTTKRPLTLQSTSTCQIKKLSRSELKQALEARIKMLKKRKLDSQNSFSGPSSTANTQNSRF